MTQPTEPIISARDVTRAFDGRIVVDDLTFDVSPGTILGVVGPSGSGKTTTIRMLTGTLGRTKGEIEVIGEDPMRFSRRVRGKLAYMPQLFSLYEDLSAQENVGFVAALYGIGPFRRTRRIERALEVVDLLDARHVFARDLSGGMQRRLELACALVHDPEVLFIDEPTAGIDPILRQAIWDELRRLRSEGRTLVVTTQYVSEAEYCDRVALILDGELVALDTPDALRQMVFGGDVLEITADRAVDPDLLAHRGRRPERAPAGAADADRHRLGCRGADAAHRRGDAGRRRRRRRDRGAPADIRRGLHRARRAASRRAQWRRVRWVASSASAPSPARSSAR